MPPGSLPTAILTEKGRLAGATEGLRPLRLRDIAQITGIPRETARRKLERLAADRYVERRPDGWVVSAERVEPELRDFTRESVYRLLAVADEIMAALKDADLNPHRQRARKAE
jgi:DNA-binding IclR family transcriptional regulator